jgi:tyrosyl-tRNA synthetase
MERSERLWRGTYQVLTEAELGERLSEGRALRVKLGVDPTSAELHLGHLALFRKLRLFQEAGAEIIFIVGDFTARIGDPSGRSATRPMMSPTNIDQNAAQYKQQVLPFLIPERTEFRRNSQWLARLEPAELIRIASQFTVAQVLARDDFSQRSAAQNPIGIHELLYPLFQAYDSVAVQADVEIGGQDQLFNLLVGRDLQKYYRMRPQIVFTIPLLEGTDGVRKMSKSYGNMIGLREPADQIFGKVMALPDGIIWKYLTLLTDIDEAEIKAMEAGAKEGTVNPRDVKMRLARDVVQQIWPGEEGRAEDSFRQAFQERAVPEDIPVWSASGSVGLVEALVESGIVASRGTAKRLIRDGAIDVNGETVRDIALVLSARVSVLKIGKFRFLRVLTEARESHAA